MILDRVQKVFRKVFDNEALIVNELSSADTVQEWDSLIHVHLISAIEEEFDVKFSFSEVLKFKNVGDLMSLIETKTKK